MGAKTGNPYIALAAALAGGLLSKKPQYTEMQRLQMQQARDLDAYSRGVPGSDPQEAAALAQARGMLGQEQQQGLGMLLGSMSPTGMTSQSDMLRNIGSSFAGERGQLDMQMLMEFLQLRRQAMLGSAQIAGDVGAKGEPGSGENLPKLFGKLAELYAQRQAMKGGGGGGGVGAESEGTGALTMPDQPAWMRGPQYPTAGGTFGKGFDPTLRPERSMLGQYQVLEPWRPSEQQRRMGF